jgi:hypothetical protein
LFTLILLYLTIDVGMIVMNEFSSGMLLLLVVMMIAAGYLVYKSFYFSRGVWRNKKIVARLRSNN